MNRPTEIAPQALQSNLRITHYIFKPTHIPTENSYMRAHILNSYGDKSLLEDVD
jgi:hypothetical protein